MKTPIKILTLVLLSAAFGLALSFDACKQNSNPADNETLYPVSITVMNATGAPQGGATVYIKGRDISDPKTSGMTNSNGTVTIQSPSGMQIIVAKIGTSFLSEKSVNIAASTSGTDAGTITLAQQAGVKVLVVKGDCEKVENVLRKIGFTTFDSIPLYSLRYSAESDSNAVLTTLRGYALVFSDCNCGDEDGYKLLARIYGRYVVQGGKIYGGHYNYYNLQTIFSPNYQSYTSSAGDSVTITTQSFTTFIGWRTAKWNSTDSRGLAYGSFSDMPANSTVHAIVTGTSPGVPVVVENRLGSGKYLWTIYHNQDIIDDPKLVEIVQYFLLAL